ncbi:hypothetical protein D3C76_976770 [compost metagenome]
MADEQVQFHTIRLGRGRNGFFCPESRFHLMGGVKPQDNWPAAAPLTQAVKTGLGAGSLVDVYGTIPAEALLTPKQLRKLAEGGKVVEEDEDFIMDDDDDKQPAGGGNAPDSNANADANDDANAGSDDDNEDGKAPEGDKLTEEQIDGSTLKNLKAFIKEKELSMEDLGLNSRSDLDEYRHALKVHFGYKMV